MKKPATRYNYARKRQATFRGVVRAAICLYLSYLGIQLAFEAYKGDSTISFPVGVLICAVFLVIAVVFGIYAINHYRRDLKEAELTPEEIAYLDEDEDA